MPKATLEEEAQWKLPKDVGLPAVLDKVEEKVIPYTDKKTGEAKTFSKWSWEFTITEGDFAGLKAWADTEDRLTNHPDNKVRQFAEALYGGAEFEVGQDLDTDDLIGLPCTLVVDNTTFEKKDGSMYYGCPVSQLFPAGTEVQPDEPPF